MKNLDWNEIARRAKTMTVSELSFAIKDCREAGEAAWELEKAGCPVSKTQGYYSDESSVYCAELKERRSV